MSRMQYVGVLAGVALVAAACQIPPGPHRVVRTHVPETPFITVVPAASTPPGRQP